jgi:hypothetical protein
MTTISVAGPEGRTVTIEAWIDPQWPGLAIHKTVLQPRGWDITHVPSGLRITTLPSKAKARIALSKIGVLTDWDRPGDKLFMPYDPATRTYDPNNAGSALMKLLATKQTILSIVKETRKG